MSGQLVTHVSLRDDKGNVVSFGPGDVVPSWARKRITNPRVWEDGDAPEPDGTGGGAVEPPPLGGAGSGRDVWAEYASHFPDKVTVEEDDKRDDIVDKLRAAGIRVE